MMRFLARALVAASVFAAGGAHAAWPDRPVTLVVPYAAGGISDVLARITAERLSVYFKQSFVVQNEVGAGGIIGTANVARAKPDGYTLLFGPVALLTLSPLTTKVNYDPDKDFIPVTVVASTPFVVTVNQSFPANTLAEFIAEVKKRPGFYTYASAGPGSTTHVSAILFLKTAGLEMIHVPYRGVGPAFADMFAGNVQMISATPVELKPFEGTGKVKPLGISSKERSRHLPDVPPIVDTLASPFAATYNGILAPTGTPPEVVDQVAKAIAAGVKTEEFSDRLLKVGVEPSGSTPGQMAKIMAVDKEAWNAVKADITAAMK
jgi:tripartite-type tricarboxylate transporter receptor subunit TctC